MTIGNASHIEKLDEIHRLRDTARALLAALEDITKIFAVSKGMQKAHSIAHKAIAQAKAAGIKVEG